MPIKKVRGKSVLTPVRDTRPVIMPRRSAFWTVFAFMMSFAGLVILGAIIVLLYKQQVLIVSSLDELDTRVANLNQQPKATDMTRSQETPISGVYLEYTACKAGFTGACDDAGIYRMAQDGSKQMILPSVRNLTGAPLTGELLQPLSQSADGRYMVFGAWSFGSERGANDRRVWIYDVQGNRLLARAEVAADAVYSPDFAYAAFGSATEGDIKDVMVVSLTENKIVSGAKAASDRSFMGPDKKVSMKWVDAKNLVVKEYSRPTEAAPAPEEKGEVTIKLK